VVARNNGSHSRLAKSKETNKASQPLRVNETSTGKKAKTRHASYRKNQFKARGKEEEFCPKFRVSYKELISIPMVAVKLRFPQKANRNLGARKNVWCEFHKGFEHDVE